ncbi:methyltransferase dimerization domain-containing protein, partial [candidate division KSB1 bacterium]
MNIDKSPAKDALLQDDIRAMASAFQKSRILLTAYELDLFTVLGEESKSSTDVAELLGTGKKATDRLMNALCAIGLLEKNEGMFLNTSLSLRFLVKGKPGYMAGLMHVVHLWDTWSTLTEAVRHGKSVVAQHIDKKNEEWRSAFIDAMHESGCKKAQSVVELLDLNGVSRVLDVGGGSGAY